MAERKIEEQPNENIYTAIFGLIGESGSGKSVFVKILTSGKPLECNTIATIGIDRRKFFITVNNDNFEIHFYDTPGGERYKSIVSQYFKRFDAVILFYEIHRPKEILDYLGKKVKEINDKLDEIGQKKKPPIFLIGTYSNLKEERTVQENEFKDFCKKNEINFVGEINMETVKYEDLKTLVERMISKLKKNELNGYKEEEIEYKKWKRFIEKENKDKKCFCCTCIIS